MPGFEKVLFKRRHYIYNTPTVVIHSIFYKEIRPPIGRFFNGEELCTGKTVLFITHPPMSRDPVIAGGLKLAMYGGETLITFFVSVSRPFKCLLKHGYELHVVIVEDSPIR